MMVEVNRKWDFDFDSGFSEIITATLWDNYGLFVEKHGKTIHNGGCSWVYPYVALCRMAPKWLLTGITILDCLLRYLISQTISNM